VRHRVFQAQNRRKPRRCHASTVSGLTMVRAERQAPHVCDRQAQSTVRRGQTQTWAAGPLHDRELVPESENFEVQSRARSKQQPQRVEQRNDDGHEWEPIRDGP
jgi:hypothetical protein